MSAPLVIRFGVLHDQLGEPKRNGRIVVADGRVVEVTDAHGTVPEGAHELEAACVIPGLINAHCHLEMNGQPQTQTVFVLTTPTQRAYLCAENARRALYAGVTAMRDLGSTESLAIDARDAIERGTIPGPTIIPAGRAICMTGGHGHFIGREADGPLDVRIAVREQLRAGAACIKFIATGGVLTKGAVPGNAQLSEDELRAGIEEAHAHGLVCAAHAIGAAGIVNALRAGIDSIEHGHLVDDEGIALFTERGAALVPTLAAVQCILDGGEEAGMPDFVLRKAREIGEHAAANLRRALAAGVHFVAGSDAGTPFNPHDGFAYELELMQSQLGMSARDVLRAATRDAARLLRIDRGTLAVGAVADLVLLERDIDSDGRPYRAPRGVVRNGEIVSMRP